MVCKLYWRALRHTYPWLPLAFTLWHLALASDRPCSRVRLRFWRLYSRINFANLLAIGMELIQPEYWA